MSATVSSPVVVFACGETLRGDDGVAHAAVDALSQRDAGTSSVRHVSSLGPEDLAGLGEDSTSIIVDAVIGVPPGEIVRMDLLDLPHGTTMRPTSSHQLPLDMIVGLAKLMGWKPRGVFLGVGGLDFTHGASLSPEVRRVVPTLGETIATEIARARLANEPRGPSVEGETTVGEAAR
jgi:hydrogenase maturation protease